MPREEATTKFQEINQAFQALSHWKETGSELDSGDEMCARGDRGDGLMDLAEMMMCVFRAPPTPPPSFEGKIGHPFISSPLVGSSSS